MTSNNNDNSIDELPQKLGSRLTALPEARPVAREIHQPLVVESCHRCADPVIARFRDALMRIQTNELKRLYNRLPALDEHSRQVIGQFADCLVTTMLRPPLESLQDEARSGAPHELVDALQRLFQL